MTRKVAMVGNRAETYRLAAEELLTESNARGDMDYETVTWAVGYLLRRADETPRAAHKGDDAEVTA